MTHASTKPRISCRKIFFTPANTGLRGNKYPELGSVWKAAHVKMVIWFLTDKISKIAAETDVPRFVFRFGFPLVLFEPHT